MRKSDKKIDNQLRLLLTDVCEKALKEIDGFQWLTHIVNYARFPQSLKIVCVFDTEEKLNRYLCSDESNWLASFIETEINKINIKLNNATRHISYDTEEKCEEQHDGNWAVRLN